MNKFCVLFVKKPQQFTCVEERVQDSCSITWKWWKMDGINQRRITVEEKWSLIKNALHLYLHIWYTFGLLGLIIMGTFIWCHQPGCHSTLCCLITVDYSTAIDRRHQW